MKGMSFFIHMKYIKKIAALFLLTSMLTSLHACSKKPEPTVNPYEGMVQVSNGMGGLMWAPIYENLALNNYDSASFYSDGSFINYEDPNFQVMRGIDVSVHQESINWELVADDGISFAMIRAGYRGYTVGQLNTDETFYQNIEGALAAGLKVGVYFFSQAVTADEAVEEADFLLSLIEDYDISMPVAFDWEYVESENGARSDDISGDVLTRCARAFCDRIRSAGYDPAVYFDKRLGYYEYNLDQLSDVKFWVVALGESPDFYYDHYMWQYSFTGQVSGINMDVDLNLCFVQSDSVSSEIA